MQVSAVLLQSLQLFGQDVFLLFDQLILLLYLSHPAVFDDHLLLLLQHLLLQLLLRHALLQLEGLLVSRHLLLDDIGVQLLLELVLEGVDQSVHVEVQYLDLLVHLLRPPLDSIIVDIDVVSVLAEHHCVLVPQHLALDPDVVDETAVDRLQVVEGVVALPVHLNGAVFLRDTQVAEYDVA